MSFVCHNILRNTFLIGLIGSVLMPASALLDTLGARVEDTEQKLSTLQLTGLPTGECLA